jgi:predicted NACHT family NTPase
VLCYDLASAIALDDEHLGHGIDPSTLKLPLKIVLRAFEKRQKIDPGYDFLDYLVDDLKTVLDGDIELTRKLLTQLFNVGSAFLLFDGLDEVLDINSRRHIVECIEKFVSTYAACPAMITSRFVGYRDAPMSDEYLILNLLDLILKRLRRFPIG